MACRSLGWELLSATGQATSKLIFSNSDPGKRQRRKVREAGGMAKNEKADLRGIGSKEKHSTGMSKRFFNSDYRHFPHSVQCRHCGSDYMRFSVNGYCQQCQQRVEFVIREHSPIRERKAGE
jgi:hypothetical protein